MGKLLVKPGELRLHYAHFGKLAGPCQTVSRSELTALCNAVQFFRSQGSDFLFVTDNKHVRNAATSIHLTAAHGNAAVSCRVAMKGVHADLWLTFANALDSFSSITVVWMKSRGSYETLASGFIPQTEFTQRGSGVAISNWLSCARSLMVFQG